MARNIKTICIVISLALAASTATGCAKKDSNALTGESVPPKAVKTITTKSESYVETVDYEGFVTAKSLKKLSFAQSGKISAIYAQVGERIKEGELLAQLDATYLNIAMENANQNVLAAQNMISQAESGIGQIDIGIEAEKLNLSKAEAAYETEQLNLEKIKDTYTSGIEKIKNTYTSAINTLKRSYDKAKDSYETSEILFNAGAISKKEYDDEKFAFETIASELNKAEQDYAADLDKAEQDYAADLALQEKNIGEARKNIDLQRLSISKLENDMSSVHQQIEGANLQKNQSVIGLKQYNEQLSESAMLSPADGYVIDVSANAGEIIGAGTPVIILKSIEQIVTIGVSVNDLPKISVGMKVDMDFSGISFSGMVSSVAQYPDENSRTYSVEIMPETNDIPAGALVSVKIPIETRSVVSIPVNSMFAINGVNYVYCAEKEEGDRYKAVMMEVLPDDVYGSNVIALNLDLGIIIVADDVKSIKENDWLSIIE